MNENERVERSEKLIKLLLELAKPTQITDVEKAQLMEELMGIYGSEGGEQYRHRYSEISRILYDQKMTLDTCDMICDKLDTLLEFIQNKQEYMVIRGSVEKLVDHITLESMRLGQIQQVLQGTEDLKGLVEQSNVILEREQSNVQQSEHIYEQQKEIAKRQSESFEEIQAMVNEVDQTKEFVHSHHIQSITILGIFAGIVFAFSGGLTLLGGVFSNVSSISGRHAILFIACIILVGIVLIDTMIVLLSFLGKYTGSSISRFWSRSISIVNGLALGAAIGLLVCYLQHI